MEVRKNKWRTIGLLISLLGIVIPIALYMFQVKHKRLSYEVVSITTLVPGGKVQDFEIKMFGRTLKNAEFHTLRIINDGDIPITRAEYDDNIEIKFSDDAEFLNVEVTKTVPEILEIQTAYDKDLVNVKPVLLNPGDSFNLQVTVTRHPPTISEGNKEYVKFGDAKFTARIAGLEEFGKISHITKRSTIKNYVLLLAGAALLMAYGYLAGNIRLVFQRNPVVIGPLEIIIGILSCGIGSVTLIDLFFTKTLPEYLSWPQNVAFVIGVVLIYSIGNGRAFFYAINLASRHRSLDSACWSCRC